jgi:hypothetical protein
VERAAGQLQIESTARSHGGGQDGMNFRGKFECTFAAFKSSALINIRQPEFQSAIDQNPESRVVDDAPSDGHVANIDDRG